MANKHKRQRDFYKKKEEWKKKLRDFESKPTFDQDKNTQACTDKTRLKDPEMGDTEL